MPCSAVFAQTGPLVGGMMLKVQDPGELLVGDPVVTLSSPGLNAVTVRPRDDGQLPDRAAGDRLYVAAVRDYSGREVQVQVADGTRTWQGRVVMQMSLALPLLAIKLEPDGRAVRLEGQEGPEDPRGSVGSARETAGGRPASLGWQERLDPGPDPEARGRGQALWLAMFLGLGFGLATLAVLFGRRPTRAVRLSSGLALGQFAPRRVDALHVAALLRGPLSGHRVIAVGRSPDALPKGLIRCLDDAPLPAELTRAVEALAATTGPQPALLVLDPSALDRPGPLDPLSDLHRRVAGRFPLFVVGASGPFQAWTPDGQEAAADGPADPS